MGAKYEALIRRRGNIAFLGMGAPPIVYGTQQVRFGEHLSEPERKWLVAVLESIVRGRTGRRV